MPRREREINCLYLFFSKFKRDFSSHLSIARPNQDSLIHSSLVYFVCVLGGRQQQQQQLLARLSAIGNDTNWTVSLPFRVCVCLRFV